MSLTRAVAANECPGLTKAGERKRGLHSGPAPGADAQEIQFPPPPRTKTFSLTHCGPTPFFTNLSAGRRIHHLIYVLFLFSFTYSNISFLFFYFYYAVLLEAIIENRVTITAVKINNRFTKCTHVPWSPVPLPSLLSVPTASPFPECRRESGVIQSP